MVKVTLLRQCYTYTFITVSCSGCFQYPVSSGGGILVALLCVLNGTSQVIQKGVRFKGHFVHITFSKAHIHPVLFCSMLCFAMEILPFSLKKQTFSSHEETWILHDILDTEYKIPASFSENCMGMVSCGVSHGQRYNDKYPHLEKMSIISGLSSSAGGPPGTIKI